MSHLTYLEAAVVGLIQGVSELFPVSSLGHNVLIPALIGGSWATDLNVAKPESPYLAFIVGMHVATAIALLIYFWRDWIRIIGGFFSSIRDRRVETRDQRLAWMIILATIPVGLVGLVADKPFREIFGKPIVAGVFLIINGVILYCGEKFRPRTSVWADQEAAALREEELVPAGPGMARQARHASGQQAMRQEEVVLAVRADERLSRMGSLQAVIIGTVQIFALLAGISRDGVTMVAGMARGLSREDAARFAFLLATPIILAAGVLEVPKLTGPLGNGIHGQILLGSVLSGVGAYLSVRFLMRYFQTRTLTPFAVYCLVFGLASVVYLGVIK
ncbi:MAG TPA: undecaprenyl-diphosphate phosphatase [Streptosporangiaceae bacterium]|nr:undecaprenyl-diphosphate phosphatase [Streptosporangiaceae bacterium]